jgi:hemolysin activation/secretion protein
MIFKVLKLTVMVCCVLASQASAEELAANMAPVSTQEVIAQNAEARNHQPSVVNTFDIFEFSVDGNSVLPNNVIEKAVYSHLGEKRTIEDVEAARAALEKAYHDAGYLTVLINIPQQEVNDAVVKLEVTESKVDKLRVTGSRYFSLGKIKEGVPELAEGHTTHFPTMQKQLAALNRSPDRRITPVMKAGKAPGTMAVELKVEDQLPLHGSVSINDRYSADTKRWRNQFNLHYDNLWQMQHSINLTLITTPEDYSESTVFAGTYSAPLDSGDYLAVYAVHSESDVAAVNTLNVLGKGNIVGLRYVHPLPALEGFYHTLTAGVDYKDFDQVVNLTGAQGNIASPISYLPFSVNWDGTWYSQKNMTKVGINLNTHFRNIVGQDKEFFDKRSGAKSNYAYMRANVDETWKFDNGSKLNVKLNTQLTGEPLISNEQFSIGGADTVRGYLESEVMGDKGYVANFEIHTPSIGPRIYDKIKDLHALFFVDFGEAITINPSKGQRELASLFSTGLGLRFNMLGFDATLDYAKALKDGADLRTKDGDDRWHVGLEYAF